MNKLHPAHLLRFTAAAAALAAAGAAQAGFWASVVDTMPAGLARASDERPGDWASFWSDAKEGASRIMSEGNTTWVAPVYTNHPTWAWDNRAEENGWPMGMGLARQVIDEKGNERMLYLVTFVDSNYRPEPMVGYTWVARWPLGASGLHVGAGYLAGVTFRGDYKWLPVAGPLPLAKIGNDWFSFYGTYIPFTNVFFFFSSITVDDNKGRKMPLPASSPWVKSPNLLYGAWGGQYADNGEKYSPSHIRNAAVWGVGLRRYSGRSWQTDLKYSRSEHDVVKLSGGTQPLKIETYSLTIAYNIDVTKRLRLFAGGGFGWSKGEASGGSDTSLHPSLTLGATWAALDNLFLTASMDTNFPRFKGVLEDRGSGYTVRSMPTNFTLGLGLAF
ncbi:hypothetical protein [uncultured Sutterella sp.]|uniref:hypothetical protein n=1 Tax=uncultured Sutterella sp. TaxID=286133 RepID=UPI0025D11236|nr:hypothetical protein [uncultured Sutterella sp.]